MGSGPCPRVSPCAPVVQGRGRRPRRPSRVSVARVRAPLRRAGRTIASASLAARRPIGLRLRGLEARAYQRRFFAFGARRTAAVARLGLRGEDFLTVGLGSSPSTETTAVAGTVFRDVGVCAAWLFVG